jgi:hypothetical protein
MFQNSAVETTRSWFQRTQFSAIGRLARLFGTATLVGGLLLALAAPASAQSLNGGGQIRAEATCSMSTHRADVKVVVDMPDGYPNGLYFYTEIYARARGASKWVFINAATSGRLTTFSNATSVYGAPMMRNQYNLVTGTFTGRGYQEILIQWRSAVPGGNWSAWYWFYVPGDPHSAVKQVGAWGDYSFVTSCSL